MASWVQVGPQGGTIHALAVAPTNENTIYVAPYTNPSHIHKSTNRGTTWNRVGTIVSLAASSIVDPTNADIVYVGGSACVYKTTDGGYTWTGSSLSDSYLNGFAIPAASPNIVLTVGQAMRSNKNVMAFFKSTNGGANWTTVMLDTATGCSYCVALDPLNPSTIYVGGTFSSGIALYPRPKIYKSTDGGTNFTDITNGIPQTSICIQALAVHPTNNNIVYAGTNGGLYRSTNGGNSWSQATTYTPILSLATTQASPDLLYAGADTCVYKSTDAGVTWFFSGSGIRYKYVYDLVASQAQPTTLYVANSAGVFKTTNGGTNWFESNDGLKASNISNLCIAPSSPSFIYAEFSTVSVYKTTNSGSSWTGLPEFLSCGTICALCTHNTDSNIVYALEGTG